MMTTARIPNWTAEKISAWQARRDREVAAAEARQSADPATRAIAGAAAGALTPRQRQKLAALAARAHRVQAGLGLWDEADKDGFRHEMLERAFGKAGVRQLCQAEYGPACEVFLKLAGVQTAQRQRPLVRRAMRAAGKSRAADDAARARHKLLEETFATAAAFGGQREAEAYAEALMQRIHRATIATATARQLWQVYFTLRNRARSKTGREGETAKNAKLETAVPGGTSPAETAGSRFVALETAVLGGTRGETTGNAPETPCKGPEGAKTRAAAENDFAGFRG